jgi:DedD protein
MSSVRHSRGLGYTEIEPMETRLKERLTGAAILVALIVLVVPELFHGQHPDVAANTSSSGEGPPVRSYTIDLSNGPRKAPLQSTDSGGDAAPNASSTGATSNANASANPGANANPPVANSGASGPTSVGNAAATPPQKSKPQPSPPPAASAPTATATASSAAPSHAAAPKTASAAAWSVQLGLFASRDNAERLVHSAQGKGFQVSVSDADGKGLYHVAATGLADRGAAQTLQGRLQAQGFQAALVAPQSGNLKSSR